MSLTSISPMGYLNPVLKLLFFLYSALLSAESVKDQIYILAQKGHHPLNYHDAREILFGRIFLKRDEDGFYIKDVYCEKIFRNSVGPDLIPDSKILNTEHSWPKKHFNRKYPFSVQESDLHHLYPTDNLANSFRGHLPFGETTFSENVPHCPLSQRDLNFHGFEPPEGIRGDLARSLFYFSIRYKIPIADGEEYFLRKWHVEDPVDNEEKLKNNLIMKFQGNRNPFIDQEELVNSIEDF